MREEVTSKKCLINSDDTRFFKDMGKYLPSLVIPPVVGFITIPVVTRLFSTKIYGNYVLVMATVSVLSAIASWAGLSIIRFYPAYKKNSKLDEFYSTTIKLTFISVVFLSLIFLCVLFVGKNHVSKGLHYLMHIGLLVFILASCFWVLQQFLRAKYQVNQYTWFSLWKSIASIGFGIALVVVFHRGIEGLLLGSILSMAIAILLLWKIAVENFSVKIRSISIPLTLKIAKYSFPMVIGNLAVWILSLSDRYVLEFFRGSHEVGIYSASYGISEKIVMLIVSLFLLASSPIGISIWEKKGERASQKFVSGVTRYYLIFCLPAVIGLSALAKPAMHILVAQTYFEGYQIVPLVALSIFLFGLVYRYSTGLIYYKKIYPAALCNIASGSFNLGLNFLLVPKYGYKAAAGTTLVSYVFLLALMIFVSKRFFVWRFPFKSLAKVFCASAVMGIIMYYIGNSLTSPVWINLILALCIGVVTYFAMLFLLREFKPSEIQALLDLKAKIWKWIRH